MNQDLGYPELPELLRSWTTVAEVMQSGTGRGKRLGWTGDCGGKTGTTTIFATRGLWVIRTR
jgi:hypothetical protein